MLYEETTGTLLCGDLFTQLGDGPALTTDDIVGPAIEAEAIFRRRRWRPTPWSPCAAGRPRAATLALMHGSSFPGDGGQALLDLAAAYEERYFASV